MLTMVNLVFKVQDMELMIRIKLKRIMIKNNGENGLGLSLYFKKFIPIVIIHIIIPINTNQV
jgi:hypothetical protein